MSLLERYGGPEHIRELLTVMTPDEQEIVAQALEFEVAEAVAELHRQDSTAWAQDILGSWLSQAQRGVMASVLANRYTAVPSAHDQGKTYSASLIAAHWLSMHEPGDAFVVSTAPTFSQVRAILWREIGRAHAKGGLPGRVNQTEWFIGDELVGYGRKPDDMDMAAFQGIHARYVLVIIDEAGGVSKALFDAVDTLVTNSDARVLAIGNPDDPGSHFAQICKPGSGWNVQQIDGLRSPNFTAERVAPYPELVAYMAEHGIEPSTEEIPDSVRPLLLDPLWVQERIERWGVESPLFVSKVRGQFPIDRSDGMVPWSWASACRQNSVQTGDVELGIDVGAGGDETVLRERVGMTAGRTWRFRDPDAMATVGQILSVVYEIHPVKVKVDAIGIGHGIAGRLAEVCTELAIEVVAVNVGESANDPKRFVNRKSEIWWEIGRELSRQRAWDLSSVDDQTLTELCEHKFSYDSSGRIKVEPKDEVRKRLGRSPDNADALLLAFYEPPVVATAPRMMSYG